MSLSVIRLWRVEKALDNLARLHFIYAKASAAGDGDTLQRVRRLTMDQLPDSLFMSPVRNILDEELKNG